LVTVAKNCWKPQKLFMRIHRISSQLLVLFVVRVNAVF